MVIKDMIKPAGLHGHVKGTGPLRTQKPVNLDFLPHNIFESFAHLHLPPNTLSNDLT